MSLIVSPCVSLQCHLLMIVEHITLLSNFLFTCQKQTNEKRNRGSGGKIESLSLLDAICGHDLAEDYWYISSSSFVFLPILSSVSVT